MKYSDLLELEVDHEIMSKHSNDHTRRAYLRNILCDVELLTDVFCNLKMTVLEFEKTIRKMGLKGNIRKYCKELNIPLPSISESFMLTSEKRKQTNIERYGGTGNPLSSGSSCKHKRDKTVFSKYGVLNVFQIDAVKSKIRETNITKYGATHFTHSRHYVKGRRTASFSTPHRIVSEYLNEIGIQHSNERRGLFTAFNESFNKYYSPVPDIIIENNNIVIEIYGTYWHADPRVYLSSDMIALYDGDVSAEYIWNFDKMRQEHMEMFGYKVYILWENDITDGSFKEKINEIFRNCID